MGNGLYYGQCCILSCSGQLFPFANLLRSKHDIVLVHSKKFEQSFFSYLSPPYLSQYCISPSFEVNFYVLSLNSQNLLI
jgi:hypothetical protein